MPIKEEDPWRQQYFAAAACPADLVISTEDADSYRMFPAQRWVYNKLLIAETQGIAHGPHGIMPDRFPVFSKPIYNLRGMGTGSQILRTPEEYQRRLQPGHMWMEYLVGEHVSSDVALVDGQPAWWRHSVGKALGGGMFDYWTVLAEARPAIESYCGEWLRRNLGGYDGLINFETIGGRIIEAHLRLIDQWPDLYGKGWVDSVVELYAHGRWNFADAGRRDGYSVVLFGPHGVTYRAPDPALIADIKRDPAISSVQITFHEDRAPERHAMPPGGFRLAIVNAWDLGAGRAARERLAEAFGLSGVSVAAARAVRAEVPRRR
jgi:hypothetical protein